MTLSKYGKIIQLSGFAVLLMLLALPVFGQVKQMVQVKTFDQKLNPFKNLELIFNETIPVKTNEKGTTFIEMNETDLPFRAVEIKNEGLEVASWNFSKGVIEIIIRKKNYQLVSVTILDEKQRPLEKKDIIFTGSKKINLKTTSTGTVELPLGLDERISSPSQFAIKGFQSIRLISNNGSYTLAVERLAPPAVISKPAETVTRSYDNEVASLDTVQSLAAFYQIVRDMAMDALNEEQKTKVDLKFNELLKGMQRSGNGEQAITFSITDSTEITDDIKRLMERALAERSQLEVQRSEFDTRIKTFDKKLAGGIAGMDANTRDQLLSDIISLENLLSENQRQFDKNQAEYQRAINLLKERYFDIKILEEKLSVVESLREAEQREFRQRIIFALIAFIIFIILIILLARFSNSLRKQKQALTQANNEITKINESLEERVISRTKLLQEAVVELDTFLYRASHDLRTPVATIEGISNLAEHISRTEFVEMIKTSTEKMNNLLKNLSVISEINHPAALKEINLSDIVKKVAAHFEEFVVRNNIQITWSCPDSIRITTYPLFLEVVIVKLVENALFFTLIKEDTEPLIRVTVSKNDTDIMLMVQDNGVGIDERVRPRIFEMFYRGHEKSKGSGLGLYIVSRCLRLMKGRIEVDSSAGQTRITVHLPDSIGIVSPPNI
jgi:signal transduction histidine kinase